MLRTRLITAAVLLPLVLGLFIYGPSWFVGGFVLLCMVLTLHEAAGILIPAFEKKLAPDAAPAKSPHTFPAITVAIGAVALIVVCNSKNEASVGIIAAGAVLALVVGCFSGRSIEQSMARATGMLLAYVYGALPWIVVWHLFLMGDNSRYPLLVMAITWAGDTGGYFGGRFYGGKIFGKDRKLAAAISPKKTWEGAIFGLLLSMVGAVVMNLCFLNTLGPLPTVILTGLVGGMSAQLGDLIESLFKRFAGVKDSGTIIPGHGGFLDRIDGILFAAPVVWAIVYYAR